DYYCLLYYSGLQVF
nr:immunoglobulin light chain junction region [Macaca mulatta]MOW27914.1 immunoglobulin light chain junction region [Macaca mulatta]MOW27938.1 immunoglobulin light chain junction region [Macaca mulatta]MOW27951.1 immunoglobulin light chain junction region [Macaca mulatta]MOW28379.1 immunoglobulin light chain junction region [Macaca mulatta]